MSFQKAGVQRNLQVFSSCESYEPNFVRINRQAELGTPYFNDTKGPLNEP